MLAREEASSEGAKNAWMPPEGPRKPVAGFFRPSGILMPPEGKRRSTGLKTAFPCTGKKYPPFGNKKSPLEGFKKLKIGGRAVIVRPQSGLDFYFSGWGVGWKLSPKCGNTPPSLVRGDQGGAQCVKTLGCVVALLAGCLCCASLCWLR